MSEETKNEVESTEPVVETATASSGQVDLEEVEDNGLAKGDTEDFKWYIAHALSGFENRVTKTLKERILNHKMKEFFADIVVPEETVVTSVNGKPRNIKKKVFPGYVLVKMHMTEKAWHLVKDTDKITGFIGGARGTPTAISLEEANNMMGLSVEGGKKKRSSTIFSSGDSVKVIEGPFTSFIGTVDAVSASGKLKVNVSIFGRPTPVELEDTQVEKA